MRKHDEHSKLPFVLWELQPWRGFMNHNDSPTVLVENLFSKNRLCDCWGSLGKSIFSYHMSGLLVSGSYFLCDYWQLFSVLSMCQKMKWFIPKHRQMAIIMSFGINMSNCWDPFLSFPFLCCFVFILAALSSGFCVFLLRMSRPWLVTFPKWHNPDCCQTRRYYWIVLKGLRFPKCETISVFTLCKSLEELER